ncbi:ricin-type beta-trefoil lectin domain protein [Phormidium sp. CCY1219]|uniref:ricin-type beta-trefoil lectin domain protein n=1 Tax=Phormidium sp. CCY1219 TaxID=2886104 RepID=UPI002D1F6500|nr:ricin-type beta-trefoil lectin domain protein [Phormidium sp. CCY1219]MEB3827061.1 ricin-type beta-trefoil lectin domain protein [Phormidium sp. CCY1219]
MNKTDLTIKINGFILDLKWGNTAPGADIIATDLDSGDRNQRWKITDSGLIVNQKNGFALDLESSTQPNTYKIIANPVRGTDGDANQQWNVTPEGLLINKATGLALTIDGRDRVTFGSLVINSYAVIATTVDPANSQNQTWQLFQNGQEIKPPAPKPKLPAVQTITSSDKRPKSAFGCAVAIEGNEAIVGAGREDSRGNDTGAAYILQLENGKWQEKQKLMPSDLEPDDRFGSSVALSGNWAIVGCPGKKRQGMPFSGAAYIYQFQNGQWQQKTQVQASNLQNGDSFGCSVAIEGKVVLVGAFGNAAPRSRRESGWGAGAAYCYQLENGQWQYKQKLQPADLTQRNQFGYSLKICEDLAIVGACQQSNYGRNEAAYIFQFQSGQWKQKQKLTPPQPTNGNFGISSTLSKDIAVVGNAIYGRNEVCIYQFQNGQWQYKQTLSEAADRRYGYGAAVALNGTTIFVGSNDAPSANNQSVGAVYRYEEQNGQWQQAHKFQPSDLASNAAFGASIALSDKILLVGASGADNATGTVYSFAR